MVHTPEKCLAILVHGFAGKRGMMEEIETRLQEEPYDQIYDHIANISFYDSDYGLNLSQPYDLKTPIYDTNTDQTLAHHFLERIIAKLNAYQEKVSLDIYAHSMGGLVTRAMVKYLADDFREGRIWIKNGAIRNIFFLGTPNHGTRLAQKAINIPADLLITGLNLLLELPSGGITAEDWRVLNSQFMQMIPKSAFLKKLNEHSKDLEEAINWVTVRGRNSMGILGIAWQPFLFSKIWFDRHFPFLHIGKIPNDGIVDAARVPLKFATNLTVSKATHMDLLKWKTKESGKKVEELLKPIILA